MEKQLCNNSPKTHRRLSLSLDASTRFTLPCQQTFQQTKETTCLFEYQPFAIAGNHWIETPSVNLTRYYSSLQLDSSSSTLSSPPSLYFSDIRAHQNSNNNNDSLVLLPFVGTKYYSVAPNACHSLVLIFYRPVLLETYQWSLTSLLCDKAFTQPFQFRISTNNTSDFSLSTIVFNVSASSTTYTLSLHSTSHNYTCNCVYFQHKQYTCTCVTLDLVVSNSANFSIQPLDSLNPFIIIHAVANQRFNITSNTLYCDSSFRQLQVLPTNASFQTNIEIAHKQLDTVLQSGNGNCSNPIITSKSFFANWTSVTSCLVAPLDHLTCVLTEDATGKMFFRYHIGPVFYGIYWIYFIPYTAFYPDPIIDVCDIDNKGTVSGYLSQRCDFTHSKRIQGSVTMTCCSDGYNNKYPLVGFGVGTDELCESDSTVLYQLTLQDGTNCDPSHINNLPINITIETNGIYSVQVQKVPVINPNRQIAVWCAVWQNNPSNVMMRFLVKEKSGVGYIKCLAGSTFKEANKGNDLICDGFNLQNGTIVGTSCCTNVFSSTITNTILKSNPVQVSVLTTIFNRKTMFVSF